MFYDAPRTIADINVISVIPNDQTRNLLELAGEGSPLDGKHGVYLDCIGITTLPENYEDRLTEILAGEFRFLKHLALDPYDIAPAKIERNIDRDREDVKFLARVIPFDLEILKDRYFKELHPAPGILEREDLTPQLWIEMIEEYRKEEYS